MNPLHSKSIMNNTIRLAGEKFPGQPDRVRIK